MARYARIVDGAVVEIREFAIEPDPNPAKGLDWRLCPRVPQPSFDPLIEKVTGPTYTVNAEDVVEVWTKVNLTAQEISDRKDVAVNGLNGSDYKPLLQILLTVVNDIRDVRAKINAEATASSHASPYTAGQTSSINMTQLKAAIKALL